MTNASFVVKLIFCVAVEVLGLFKRSSPVCLPLDLDLYSATVNSTPGKTKQHREAAG